MKQETFTTLFEYLDRPAKLDISGQVYKAAKNNNIEMRKRSIVSNTYTGLVTEYPESFLDKFFGKQPANATPKQLDLYELIMTRLDRLEKKLDDVLQQLYYSTMPENDYRVSDSDDLPF